LGKEKERRVGGRGPPLEPAKLPEPPELSPIEALKRAIKRLLELAG